MEWCFVLGIGVFTPTSEIKSRSSFVGSESIASALGLEGKDCNSGMLLVRLSEPGGLTAVSRYTDKTGALPQKQSSELGL